jgi:hypothetical protein
MEKENSYPRSDDQHQLNKEKINIKFLSNQVTQRATMHSFPGDIFFAWNKGTGTLRSDMALGQENRKCPETRKVNRTFQMPQVTPSFPTLLRLLLLQPPPKN